MKLERFEKKKSPLKTNGDFYFKLKNRLLLKADFVWGEIWDSNPRPLGPQPNALTN